MVVTTNFRMRDGGGGRPERKWSRWNLASLLLAWVRTPRQFMSLHWQEKVLEHRNAAAPDMSDDKVIFQWYNFINDIPKNAVKNHETELAAF